MFAVVSKLPYPLLPCDLHQKIHRKKLQNREYFVPQYGHHYHRLSKI